MHSEQKRQPGGPALATTELWIAPVTNGEIQRTPYLTSEISVDFRPIRMGSKTLVQLLEKRHYGFELFYENFVRKTFRSRVDLSSQFNRVFGIGDNRKGAVDLFSKAGNLSLKAGHAFYRSGGAENARSSRQTSESR